MRVGRADLLRLMVALGEDQAEEVGEWLGFERQASSESDGDQGDPGAEHAALQRVAAAVPSAAEVAARVQVPVPLWRVEQVEVRQPEDASTPDLGPALLERDLRGSRRDLDGVPCDPVCTWAQLGPRLFRAVRREVRSHQPDVQRAVRQLSAGAPLQWLPRARRWVWPRRVDVWLDRSRRQAGLVAEQEEVVRQLQRHVGRRGVRDAVVDPHAFRGARGHAEAVVLLGDRAAAGEGAWHRMDRQLQAAGGRAVVLTAGPAGGVGEVAWVRGGRRCSWEERQRRAEWLLLLCAMAAVVHLGLLRAIRRLLGPDDADLQTEGDALAHGWVRSAGGGAFVLHPEHARELRGRFAQVVPPDLRARIAVVMAELHAGMPEELQRIERLTWAFLVGEAPEALRATSHDRAWLQRLVAQLVSRGEGWDEPVRRWLEGAPQGLYDGAGAELQTLHRLWAVAFHDDDEVQVPEGLDPQLLAQMRRRRPPARRFALQQEGGALVLRQPPAPGEPPLAGSPLGLIRARGVLLTGTGGAQQQHPEGPQPKARVQRNCSATESRGIPVQAGLRIELPRVRQGAGIPSWAVSAGADAYGRWATFEVGGVRHTMRWIEPGRFLMGSPEEQEGRYADEVQHWVTITRGFWLGATPVTQALWEAVMGNNPSHFQGADRPVEQISWEDCQRFAERLAEQVPGVPWRLPTEAEWEFAARAGTQGPTWGPALDEVAWHSGNSGRETHPVGGKAVNPWGLHDVLGNVREWCEDHVVGSTEPLPSEEQVDPLGRAGSGRVFRGGSWSDHARNVRAAYRLANDPGDRNRYLGIRLAGGPVLQGGGAPTGRPEAPGDRAEPVPQLHPRVLVVDTVDQEHRLAPWTPEPWAVASGRDRWGLWAAFEVGGVQARMRWIPPGVFTMGSPSSEQGRYPDRETQHQVTLTRGYWLGETPVTQALWEAVTGSNPSCFVSPTRPVEQVSWQDCRSFCAMLGEHVGGLQPRLPTEAEWERACRAGTATATWLGDLEILGENNAPLLDAIAWYGGNSGLGFELQNGFDSREWPDKQFPHERAGTRPVGTKAVNPWGLYDMLGNVHEWCEDATDWPPAGHSEPRVDPLSTSGSDRVIRGGSWVDLARSVRAAYRSAGVPGDRDRNLGIRLAGGPG
ncbi:MAG: formylglycine-generating enzyme family protein, partial [Myxococcales bacterium]|nr:formylglycine-generating enzyme family protein [Myxococcales bacterium]